MVFEESEEILRFLIGRWRARNLSLRPRILEGSDIEKQLHQALQHTFKSTRTRDCFAIQAELLVLRSYSLPPAENPPCSTKGTGCQKRVPQVSGMIVTSRTFRPAAVQGLDILRTLPFSNSSSDGQPSVNRRIIFILRRRLPCQSRNPEILRATSRYTQDIRRTARDEHQEASGSFEQSALRTRQCGSTGLNSAASLPSYLHVAHYQTCIPTFLLR